MSNVDLTTPDRKILFVDDEEFVRMFLTKMFSKNFTVFTASDGVEGLKIKKAESIRIIYTDINMPNMSGMELCEIIRREDPVSIVAGFTADSGTFQLLTMREGGFDDYIQKPFVKEELTQSVVDSSRRMKRWLKK